MKIAGVFTVPVSAGSLIVTVKSGLAAAFTVSVTAVGRFGPLAVVPRIITENIPVGVFDAVVMVRLTETGFADVGLTMFDGVKLQFVPAGNPRQLRFTAPLKAPAAVT